MPDEAPQQPPQDADTDGSSQDCVILHVVDVAAHDMAELFSPPRLSKHSLSGLRPSHAFDLLDGIDLCTVLGRALVWASLQTRPPSVCRGKPTHALLSVA